MFEFWIGVENVYKNNVDRDRFVADRLIDCQKDKEATAICVNLIIKEIQLLE